jgi:transcriptional regulator with XRE-family HTH domain
MSENNGSNPVKEVRERLGLTQQQMADELRMSLMTARRCEYEKRIPGTRAGKEELKRLAKKAGVRIEGITHVGKLTIK